MISASKTIIGSPEHFELGSAVQLVADFLMLLALLQDKFFVDASPEPRILLGKFLGTFFGFFCLPVARGGRRCFLYAVFYQIVYYRFGAPQRQMLVIFAVSLVVAMGAEFNGNVRVLFQQRYH